MSKEPHTLRQPSQICILVGMGVAVIGSFLIAIVLGTGYGFGLVLHLILAGLVGWMLAVRCTENGDELFGLVGFFYTPRVAETVERLAETAKAEADRVAEAAKRLPEQVADAASRGTDGSERETSGRATDVSGQAAAGTEAAPARPVPAGPVPAQPAPAQPAPAEAAPAHPPGGTPPDEGSKPPLLDAPRGEPDDLTRINGVGLKLAAMLNEVGIWHFAQIATWTEDELAWVDSHLGAFRGRARRDDWIGQARALAAGGSPATPAGNNGGQDNP